MDLNELKNDVVGFVAENPVGVAVGTGAAIVGVGLVGAAVLGSSRKKKTSRGRKRDRKFKSKQKHEQRYKRKRKFKVYKSKKHKMKTKRKGIKYTKNGQPYVILANGRARFIKGKRRAK